MGLFRINEHNMVKNPNWKEADQLAIYKHDQGVELGSTEKQFQLSGQSWTRTCDLRTTTPLLMRALSLVTTLS